jgi:hypothetical protein
MKAIIKTITIFTLVCLCEYGFAGRWVTGDLHNHTATSSDVSNGTAMSSMANAMGCGYNFIIITDHNEWGEWTNGNITEANNLYADKDHIVLLGNEVSCTQHWTVANVKYEDRSVINTTTSVKLDRWIEFVTNITAIGGWAHMNHPQRSDILAGAAELKTITGAGMGGIEIFNGGGWEHSADLWRIGGWWDDALAEGCRIAPIASTDNHGGNHYDGYARTHVYVEGDSLTEQAIFDGLRAGRVWAVGQEYSYGAIRAGHFNMEFTVNGAMMGDTVQAGDNTQITMKATLDTPAHDIMPKVSSVKLIMDGEPVFGEAPNGPVFEKTITLSTTGKSYARLEVLAANTRSPGSILKAFSGAIYFTPGTTSSQQNVMNSRTFAPGLNVSPNPASTHTFITVNQQGPAAFKVFDLSGKLVKSIGSDGQNLSAGTGLDVSGLSSGIYILKARVGQKVLLKRFFVQR